MAKLGLESGRCISADIEMFFGFLGVEAPKRTFTSLASQFLERSPLQYLGT